MFGMGYRFLRNCRHFILPPNFGQCAPKPTFSIRGQCLHTTPARRTVDPFRQMESIMKEMDRRMKQNFEAACTPGFMRPFVWSARDPNCVTAEPSAPVQRTFGSMVDVSEGGNFKLQFTCTDCKPEDISVTLKDRVLTVSLKCVVEETNSKVSRQMELQQTLPEGVDCDQLESSLSPDGELTVMAPRTPPQGPQHIKINRQ